MADVKISALPASTTPLAGTEVLPIVQGTTTKKVAVSDLTAGRAVSALSITSTNDASISGLTVGKGGGSVASNTAVGLSAGSSNVTGGFNVFVGQQAGNSVTGSRGTYVGFQAGFNASNSGDNYNTAIGMYALNSTSSSSGYFNTALGALALTGISSGYQNVGCGYGAGSGITSGNSNVVIGAYSGAAAPISATGSNYVVLSDGAGNIVASTKTAQTFALQSGTLSAGTGIAFPATQSASTDANTLDDYEEGTYTPVVTAGSGSITSYTASGAYTKVGNLVTLSVDITITDNGTGATNINVTLPFTCASTSTYMFGVGQEIAQVGTRLYLQVLSNNNTVATITNISSTYPIVANNSRLVGSITYRSV